MEKEQRSRLQKATQEARRLLEEEFSRQLLETYDINVAAGRWSEEPGAHLQAEQRLLREKLLAWIEHRSAQIKDEKEALLLALREMAFTALNRFVALKLMEARELVRPCVSGGLESEGFQEFTAVAQGLLVNQESSYRLYFETIFEDVSRELRALFDPRDPVSLLWPKRSALLQLLGILNRPDLAELWGEDETLGWVYQYFNGDNERKIMRKESPSPRNSREMAVRNQFFTPRYIVEFLVDNTLGRFWSKENGESANAISGCHYLVKEMLQERGENQGLQITHHRAVDPREITILDPACGSMHFGLYCFDVLSHIYKDSWRRRTGHLGEGINDCDTTSFQALSDLCKTEIELIKQIPKLIIENNLFGIDIDERCAQIATLALWLKAHRFWSENNIDASERPRIDEFNIIHVDSARIDQQLLVRHCESLGDEPLAEIAIELIAELFKKLELADELGFLIRVETHIKKLVSTLSDSFRQLPLYWQKQLFADKPHYSHSEIPSNNGVALAVNEASDSAKSIMACLLSKESVSNLSTSLILDELRSANKFIRILSKKYSVILTNPPFGRVGKRAEALIKQEYPDGYIDIYCCFMLRASEMLKANGVLGCISSRSYYNAVTLTGFRSHLIPRLEFLVDLGAGVLDSAMVQTSLVVATNKPTTNDVFCLDLKGTGQKQNKLSASCIALGNNTDSDFIRRDRNDFFKMPGNQLLFTLDNKSFESSQATLEPEGAHVRAGLNTFNDERFLRLWWELDAQSIGREKTWTNHWKGGEYETYYTDINVVCKWNRDGREMRALNHKLHGMEAQAKQGSRFYFLPGCAYTYRGKGFNARILPRDCTFAVNGPVVHPSSDVDPLYLLAWLNHSSIRALAQAQANSNLYTPGIVKKLPWCYPSDHEIIEEVVRLTSEIVVSKRNVYSFLETSLQFSPQFGNSKSLLEAFHGYRQQLAECNQLVEQNSLQLDELLTSADDSLGMVNPEEHSVFISDHNLNKRVSLGMRDFSLGLLSYVVGISLGRYYEHKGFGSRIEDLFSPLANTSRLVIGEDQVPASNRAGYLLLERGNSWDSGAYLERAFEAAFPDSSKVIAQEMCSELKVGSINDAVLDPSLFFDFHLNSFTASRRSAPIYWLLGSGDYSYALILEATLLTDDSFYRIYNESIVPCLENQERVLSRMIAEGSSEAAEIDKITRCIHDLKTLAKELELVAGIWKHFPDDGIEIRSSLCWRLQLHSRWREACCQTWSRLVNEELDWSQIALYLWPERVIKKCQTDLDLAIAHSLEERLWQETNNGKWLQRQVSEAELQALIAEHSKPAVQNALERFLAASPPVAAARTRATRSAKSPSTSTTRRPRGSAPEVDAETSRQTLLVLTAAPAEGLGRNAIAELLDVEAASLTAVIKQLKEGGQIEQLGAARGAKYRLTEAGVAAVESQAGEDD